MQCNIVLWFINALEYNIMPLCVNRSYSVQRIRCKAFKCVLTVVYIWLCGWSACLACVARGALCLLCACVRACLLIAVKLAVVACLIDCPLLL